jgi:putative membrane protein insertion efficiency factor
MTRIIIMLINIYKITLSGLFPNTCRFLPTCSSYAKESFEKHGLWNGLRLTINRILRCRPGGGFGYDPVPGS